MTTTNNVNGAGGAESRKKLGIYVHIPFCVKKCEYCDFFSQEIDLRPWEETFLEKSFSPIPSSKNFHLYVDNLIEDLEATCFEDGVDTVYIGGGTPTALPSFLLCKILEAVFRFLPVERGAEITVEANPGTVDFEYLLALKQAGVTRLSFGVQSTHDFLLAACGRVHSFADFVENFHAARRAGFDNISVDLMFALPGQSQAHWHSTLCEIVALAPQHISAYSLTPAENTPLMARLERGEITLPDDAADREMYHHARRFLAENGYTHYEISNFARPGFESRHNINCWKMQPYIGFGAGAHSFDGKSRWENEKSTRNTAHNESFFEEGSGETFFPKKVSPEVLTKKDLQTETMMLGLRMMSGVCEDEFAGKFGARPSQVFGEEIAALKKDGLLESADGRLFLTERGLDLANRVFMAFVD